MSPIRKGRVAAAPSIGGDNGTSRDPSGPVRTVPLPLPLRLWARTSGRSFRGQGKVGSVLAARLLDQGVAYRSRSGIVLRVDPADQWQVLMALGFYERSLTAIVSDLARPGGIVLDAGSHVGYLGLIAARGVGPHGEVHTFECDPRVVPRLREHVVLNEMPWVQVNEGAVMAESGLEVTLDMTPQWGWSTTRVHWENPGQTEQVTVRSIALDAYAADHDLDLSRLALIKVDVEGAELEALSGARDLLTRSSPAVLVEFVPERMVRLGQRPEELFTLMGESGYEAWSAVPRQRGAYQLVPHDGRTEGDIAFFKSGSVRPR